MWVEQVGETDALETRNTQSKCICDDGIYGARNRIAEKHFVASGAVEGTTYFKTAWLTWLNIGLVPRRCRRYVFCSPVLVEKNKRATRATSRGWTNQLCDSLKHFVSEILVLQNGIDIIVICFENCRDKTGTRLGFELTTEPTNNCATSMWRPLYPTHPYQLITMAW